MNREQVYASLARMAGEMGVRFAIQAEENGSIDTAETAAMWFQTALELPEIERRTREPRPYPADDLPPMDFFDVMGERR